MTASTLLLGRVGVLLLLAAAGYLTLGVIGHGAALRSAWQRREDHLRRELRFLRSPLSATLLLGAQVAAVCFATGAALLGYWPGAMALGLMALLGPPLGLRRARLQRVQRIEAQLEGWVTVVAHALEATPSLGEALRGSTHLVERPLRDEVTQLLAEHQLGSPLDRALHSAGRRVQSRLFSAVLLTLRIGRNTGGSLQEILHTTAASLREMERLEGVVRTKTAEGKAQAAVISALPFPLYFGIRALAPGFFDPLETTPLGHVLVATATVLWISAALLARRFLAVDL